MTKRYNTPHRIRVVRTRLSEDEYADFTARLAPYGISQSEFLRQVIRRTTIRPIIHVSAVNDELLSAVGKLTAEYGRIGGNLNQIARYLNEYGAPYNALSGEVRAAIADLAARDGVMEQFRNRLQTKLLNSDQPQWGFAKKKEYFDLRVIKQVCGRARDLPVPNTLIVRCWLKMLVDGLRRGEIENASAPIVRLQELCYQVKHEGLVIRLAEARWSQTATRSSSTILGADLEF